MQIVQIFPFSFPGAGVPGIAWNLDRAFRDLDIDSVTFTYSMVRRGKPGPRERGRLSARIIQAWRTVWFSTVGTARAKQFLRDRPGAIAICHNNVMTGDIFVNHGVLLAAMRANGNSIWKFFRNPVSVFNLARDWLRFHIDIHRVFVVLTPREREALHSIFGRVRAREVVIPNGIDLELFGPPTPSERNAARALFHLEKEARVALFVGHEFDRKGPGVLIQAMVDAPTLLLLVLGGDVSMVERARQHAVNLGVERRVLLLGEQRELGTYYAASDMFVLPSAYESSGLVFLEALASGLPVIATAVGVATTVVRDGVNGYIVARDPREIADRMEPLAALDIAPWRERARASVGDYSWAAIAARYVALAEELVGERKTA